MLDSRSGTHDADFLIVGGGIAGAGAAYELSAFASVILLEAEPHCGWHATGRSAASFTENYGGMEVRRLVLASRDFLETPPADFCGYPLLTGRGMLTIAREDQLDLLTAQLERAQILVPSIASVDVGAALELVPVLRRECLAGAFFEPHCMDIDVNGLHQGFLTAARKRGARIHVDARVNAIEHNGGRWSAVTDHGVFRSAQIVNAAGAWADEVARLAGMRPLGLEPRRRTAFHVAVPSGMEAAGWPMVDDVGGDFYFKPDAGRLFVSPADATPSVPMDAYADDHDVAIGVERLERVTSIRVQRVIRSWAGLRTFAADGVPVMGPDARTEGFFWLAGQGGYGIKTSPALSRACASLLRNGKFPPDLERLGLYAADLSPDRAALARPADAPSPSLHPELS